MQTDNQSVDHTVLSAASLPIASIMKKGPINRRPDEMMDSSSKFVSYFDAMKSTRSDEYQFPTEFCNNSKSFLQGKLPCWATGMKNKVELVDIPAVRFIYNLLKKSTYWWKFMELPGGMLSREARLLLVSVTNQPIESLGFVSKERLLSMPTSKISLNRFKNYIATLDGLLISILLASQGHPEICNWKFFDAIIVTYLKSSIFDLFSNRLEETYYKKLKKVRGVMKDLLLKERSDKNFYFEPQFWYFNKIIKLLGLAKEIPHPKGIVSIAYLIQTRSVGLPPAPIRHEAVIKFLKLVTQNPAPLSMEESREIYMGAISVAKSIIHKKNFNNMLNRALIESKISLSNSSSFFFPRSQGGKTYAFNRFFNKFVIGREVKIYNLHNGQISGIEVPNRKEPEKIGYWMFHYCIGVAMRDLTDEKDESAPDIGDVRYSVVLEPGKARIITVSRLEHSMILHPLAHILAVLISSVPSSSTGMKASNHGYDFYKRIERKNVPSDGIHKDEDDYAPTSTFLASEDWTTATDSENPKGIKMGLDGFTKTLGMPRFYSQLCIQLLVMPRRIYSEEILKHFNFYQIVGLKKTGIFQGDPLTKQALHLTHLIARRISENILRSVQLNPIVIDTNNERVKSARMKLKALFKPHQDTDLTKGRIGPHGSYVNSTLRVDTQAA